MPDIDVPYVSQGDADLGCVPACIKMLVEFYSRKYPDIPNPSIVAIGKAIGYEEEDGTPLDHVWHVDRLLVGNKHRLQFQHEEYADFKDIKKELLSDKPVIAWLNYVRPEGRRV